MHDARNRGRSSELPAIGAEFISASCWLPLPLPSDPAEYRRMWRATCRSTTTVATLWVKCRRLLLSAQCLPTVGRAPIRRIMSTVTPQQKADAAHSRERRSDYADAASARKAVGQVRGARAGALPGPRAWARRGRDGDVNRDVLRIRDCAVSCAVVVCGIRQVLPRIRQPRTFP